MQFKKGNLFDTELSCIGHGVNTKGLMGAGIAKQFQDRFRTNYEIYVEQCLVGGLTAGDVLITVEVIPDAQPGKQAVVVVNMASQDQPGADATYERLFDSALAAAKQLKGVGVKACAIPEIGCGIGGLEWEWAKVVLKSVELIVGDFEWEVWSL